jgi:hypothetical protein
MSRLSARNDPATGGPLGFLVLVLVFCPVLVTSSEAPIANHVSLIRIDVEGYELPVLQAALDTIRGWQPAIIVEMLAGEVYEQASPELREPVEAIRGLLGGLGHERISISGEGGCDYLALYKRDR